MMATDQKIDYPDPVPAPAPNAVAELNITHLRINANQATLVQLHEVVAVPVPRPRTISQRPPSVSSHGSNPVDNNPLPPHGRNNSQPPVVCIPVPLPRSNLRSQRTSRQTRPRDRRVSLPPPAVAPPPAPPRSEHDKSKSRCCNCFMMVPFTLALVLMVLSVATFAVKNADVSKHCNGSSCLLSCDDQLISSYRGCAIVYSGGGVVCMVAILFIASLIRRTCYGLQVFRACIVCELFTLLILLAVAMWVSTILSLGVGTNSCLKNRCQKFLDITDLLDFLKQSEIAAWLSSLTMLVIVFIWTLLSIGTCCEDSGYRRRRRPLQGDAEPLLHR